MRVHQPEVTYAPAPLGQRLLRRLLGSFFCRGPCLAERPAPAGLDGRLPYAELPPELVDVLIPPVLPVHGDQALRGAAALDGPRHEVAEELLALRLSEAEVTECSGEPGHGEPKVGELEELDRELGLDVHGHVHDAVVEVVALAIALHDVRELGVVDIVHLARRVRCE